MPTVQGLELRSSLNVPILGHENAMLGVMQWLGVQPGQFDRHDEWIAPALAAQAAIAIQHSQMTDTLLANPNLHHEVEVARQIRVGALPASIPERGRLRNYK